MIRNYTKNEIKIIEDFLQQDKLADVSCFLYEIDKKIFKRHLKHFSKQEKVNYKLVVCASQNVMLDLSMDLSDKYREIIRQSVMSTLDQHTLCLMDDGRLAYGLTAVGSRLATTLLLKDEDVKKLLNDKVDITNWSIGYSYDDDRDFVFYLDGRLATEFISEQADKIALHLLNLRGNI